MIKSKVAGLIMTVILLFASCGKLPKISKIGLPESDDYKLFASRAIEPRANAFHFYQSGRKLNLGETIDAGDQRRGTRTFGRYGARIT